MTIKEQIIELLNQYKQDFHEKTGLELIIIPKVILPTVSLQELQQSICSFQKVPDDKFFSNSNLGLVAREIFVHIAEKMGHPREDIAYFMDVLPSSIFKHRNQFNGKMRDRNYSYKFYATLENIYMNEKGNILTMKDIDIHKKIQQYDDILFT